MLKLELSIEPKSVMSGFCWAYTNALLGKLKALDEEDRVFLYGGNKALHESECASELTEIANSVISQISQQTNLRDLSGAARPDQIGSLIGNCEEFLAIFKPQTQAIDKGKLMGEIVEAIFNGGLADQTAAKVMDLLKKYQLI